MKLAAMALATVVALAGCAENAEEPTATFAKCERALKATLKAPSSYQRVSALEPCEMFCAIEYDAQNSFGALLRGKGFCSIDQKTGVASWFEPPEVIGASSP